MDLITFVDSSSMTDKISSTMSRQRVGNSKRNEPLTNASNSNDICASLETSLRIIRRKKKTNGGALQFQIGDLEKG